MGRIPLVFQKVKAKIFGSTLLHKTDIKRQVVYQTSVVVIKSGDALLVEKKNNTFSALHVLF